MASWRFVRMLPASSKLNLSFNNSSWIVSMAQSYICDQATKRVNEENMLTRIVSNSLLGLS